MVRPLNPRPIPIVGAHGEPEEHGVAWPWVASFAAFFGYLAYILSRPFYSGLFWMDYMQDDFFYYLKVAQNISLGHGSTFHGAVPTNGYHPLFEGLLVALAPILRTPQHVLAFQAAMILAASVATLWICLRVFRRAGANATLAAALSACITLYALLFFTTVWKSRWPSHSRWPHLR